MATDCYGSPIKYYVHHDGLGQEMTYKPYETSDFKADLSKGKDGEALAKALLLNDEIEVEVKTDLKWKETGNLYIETECYIHATGQYEPSGLSTTTADVWAFVLGQSVYYVKVDCLKRVVEHFGREVECKIEPNPSRGKLITPQQLMEMEGRRSK
jgi:hypothetical protein